MTKTGYRLGDIGETLWWGDLRDIITHLPQDSALFRARHPQSWWWTPEFDLLSALITAIQWGNWQRGGGKGDKPKPIERPVDKPPKIGSDPTSAAELHARKEALKTMMERTDGGN